MKKLRITKTVKVLLAAIITFTSVGLFNLTVNADNEFDIQESVTYSEDNSEATITLDIASIGEDYVLEEVKNPDGTVMDLTNLNYIVTENKTYEFNISYFDKENIRQEYIKEIEVDGIKIIDRSGLARATDYTSQVEILDFDILDRNGVPLSETNEASNGGSYQLVVDWTLSPSGGLTLQAGDTFSIPLPKNEIKGAWSALTSEYVNFTDSTGTIVLGQWKIENGRIIVVLGSEASNSHIINGKMITGTNTVHVNNVQGITQNVTMGTISKVIKFKTTVLNESSTADTKSANSVSNNSISWGIMVNNNGAHELSAQPYGSNYTIRDTYVEDTLSGEFNSININGVIRTPVDLVEGKPSNASSNYSLISKFTRIYQNVGESYSAFKNRLQPLEYGVYVDDSGIQTVVIYFGRMGDNGLKYSDVDSNFINTAVNRAINTNGYYDESDRK